ncbi:VOC family protein [Hymenobacter jejuensis]|uniref:VOC domain-containing protein n=1 Tax=Hymenobacter jejuensis TaxID=2502781 RepID=A0A5B7ZVQ5_9BACT|nr:VOC family protein [Hymenobacter jejuensis]QDA58947.1 hypothetical protein FHG12_01990 [Hymenobacter jejuensis]
MPAMNITPLPYAALAPDQIGIRPPDGRLPADIRIGTVALQIADLARSLAFYEDVLGFQVLRRSEGTPAAGAVAELGAAGSEQALLVLHEQLGVRPVPRRGLLGLYHFAILLPSRADLGRFLRHVHVLGVRIGSSDHLYSEATYLTDPDGITVEVYRDRPRSEWQVSEQGEIQSALDPLDLPAVLQAAGDTRWQGLPAGTTIGHMHFYTGSLAQAAAFYHAALGLDKVTWSLPGALFVSAGGYHHHVGLNVWAAGSPAATAQDARLLSWELWLPDAASRDAAAARLQQAGFPTEPAPEGIAATDPWGNRLLLRTDGERARH